MMEIVGEGVGVSDMTTADADDSTTADPVAGALV